MKVWTVTVNPAIDYSSVVDHVLPTIKLRTREERFDPGGGGINVARVIRELGGVPVCALYLAGGVTGGVFEGLLARTGVGGERLAIRGDTRIAHVVRETASGQEYRFTPAGPEVAESEWRACLARIAALDADILILSGSLAPGMPADFYARAIRAVRGRGVRVALDTSGPALFHALEAGVWLATPNLREAESLLGMRAATPAEEEALAQALVARGRAALAVITLGHRGAVLASEEGVLRLAAPRVPTVSTVGAGDAFLGAMVWALARGLPVAEAFRWGVAAGAATALTPGTGLCCRAEVERLYQTLPAPTPATGASSAGGEQPSHRQP